MGGSSTKSFLTRTSSLTFSSDITGNYAVFLILEGEIGAPTGG